MIDSEITKLLKKHPKTGPTFIRAVPADGIPLLDCFPYAVIINTQQHNLPGQHWVAVYVDSPNIVEYFDSYGLLPNSDIASFMKCFPINRRHTFTFQRLNTKVCGHYCVYFLIKRCSGQSFHQIVKRLCKEMPRTDKFVQEYVQRLVS